MCEPNSEKVSEISAESPTPTTPVGAQPVETAEPKNSERIKATRHPRWTRQETLVLIEAKKVIENGDQVCRYRSSTSGLVQTDPKWDLVSSLCQQHGVKRGAVQCRKRWGNLLTDFRKIKKWESNIKDESESFWIMRNDVRKENKLPGFFDSVVYNVLDGGVCTAAAFPLTLIKMMPRAENGDPVEGAPVLEQCNKEDENEEDEDEAIVDSDKMGWSTEEENNETNTNGNMVNSPFKTPNAKKSNIIGSLKVTPPAITIPGSAGNIFSFHLNVHFKFRNNIYISVNLIVLLLKNDHCLTTSMYFYFTLNTNQYACDSLRICRLSFTYFLLINYFRVALHW